MIKKDTVAPVLTASTNLASGPFITSVAVGLNPDGGEQVRYTTDGSDPTPNNSKVYEGTRFNLGTGSHAVNAFSVDDAGNREDAAFAYDVQAPPSPPNAAPVARANAYSANEDSILRGASVLGNDTDANGDPADGQAGQGDHEG